jgi:hypothetical protein
MWGNDQEVAMIEIMLIVGVAILVAICIGDLIAPLPRATAAENGCGQGSTLYLQGAGMILLGESAGFGNRRRMISPVI